MERCAQIVQQRDALLEDAQREQTVYQREDAEAETLYRAFDHAYNSGVSKAVLRHYGKAYLYHARKAQEAEKKWRNSSSEARMLNRLWRRLCGRRR